MNNSNPNDLRSGENEEKILVVLEEYWEHNKGEPQISIQNLSEKTGINISELYKPLKSLEEKLWIKSNLTVSGQIGEVEIKSRGLKAVQDFSQRKSQDENLCLANVPKEENFPLTGQKKCRTEINEGFEEQLEKHYELFWKLASSRRYPEITYSYDTDEGYIIVLKNHLLQVCKEIGMSDNSSQIDHIFSGSLRVFSKKISQHIDDLKLCKNKCDSWQSTYPQNPSITRSIQILKEIKKQWERTSTTLLSFSSSEVLSEYQVLAKYKADYQQVETSVNNLIKSLEDIECSSEIPVEIKMNIRRHSSIFFDKAPFCLSHVNTLLSDIVE